MEYNILHLSVFVRLEVYDILNAEEIEVRLGVSVGWVLFARQIANYDAIDISLKPLPSRAAPNIRLMEVCLSVPLPIILQFGGCKLIVESKVSAVKNLAQLLKAYSRNVVGGEREAQKFLESGELVGRQQTLHMREKLAQRLR